MKIVSAEQMRQLEAAVVDSGRATWDSLMEQVGSNMATFALHILDEPTTSKVVILIGPGNNGGDGLVIAHRLAEAGAAITLGLWKRAAYSDDWLWHALKPFDLTIVEIDSDTKLDVITQALTQAHLAIDALLGIGVSRPLEGLIAQLVGRLNTTDVPVMAVDIPSGLDADSGKIWGTVVQADWTVTAGLIKRGMRLYPGAKAVGRLEIALIDLPEEMETRVKTSELTVENLKALLPDRPQDSHKDDFGRVIIVAGSLFYPGAAWMTAAAAARSGVGVVTVACPRSIYGATSSQLHEATYIPLPEKEAGALSTDGVKIIRKRLGRYKAMVLGPGLGTEESTVEFFSSLLDLEAPKRKPPVGFFPQATESGASTTKRKAALGFMGFQSDAESSEGDEDAQGLPPLVIDADGLNVLAKIENWFEALREHPVILTPHPGEMKRLLDVETLEDPIQAASDAAAEWGVVVVLKGATTVIAAPDGKVVLHSGANSALATAGTGDVLAGLMGGLLAQGLEPFEAAQVAVGVHGMAGALVQDTLGTRGVIAGDVIAHLPQAWQKLEKAGS